MVIDFNALVHGLGAGLDPQNIIAALLGALLGTAVGVLPGMSPTVAIALLLIPTINLPPLTGLVMLSAVFFGTQYGDSMTAILLNVPSEAAAFVVGLDGHPMTERGRAGPALAVAATASFIGAVIGLIGLVLFAGAFSQLLFEFGPVEIASLAIFGLIALSRITGTTLARGLVALGIGLMIPTVGLDPTGVPRYTFGLPVLLQGFEFVPAVLGLVGVAELIENVVDQGRVMHPRVSLSLRSLLPNVAEWRRSIAASLRGSIVGFFLGLLPGPSLTLATFASYRLEKAVSRHPERFGTGEIEGVAGPKSADDSAVSAHLAALMTLGIPFTPVTAVLYAGFVLHGIHPGPLLIRDSPDVFFGLVAAMLIGNAALLVLNFPLVSLWVNLLRIPKDVLSAGLALLILIGSFSLRNSSLDMLTTLGAGVLGYVLPKIGFDRTLVLLALILGPILEETIRQSLTLSGGDPTIFLARPISAVFMSLTALILVLPSVLSMLRRTRQALGHPSGNPPPASGG